METKQYYEFKLDEKGIEEYKRKFHELLEDMFDKKIDINSIDVYINQDGQYKFGYSKFDSYDQFAIEYNPIFSGNSIKMKLSINTNNTKVKLSKIV